MALTNSHHFRREYGLLTLVWFAVHALPLYWLTEGRNYTGEIVQSRTLLDYGFWARKGAYLTGIMSAGIVPNPADFNYTNHPYPIVWLYTLLYWLFGPAGDFALIALTGLAGCLLTYRFLKEFFTLKVAWFTTVLLTAAHATVEFATNTEAIALSTIIWPLAGLAIIGLRSSRPRIKAAAPWLLGLVVFLSGQISWFALTTVPVLLLLCLPLGVSPREAIRHPASISGWIPILGGAMATLAVFIGQIVEYSPDLRANLHYLGAQSGADGNGFLATRLNQAPVLLLRMLLAGPALWLGAVVGLTQFRKPLGSPASPPANVSQRRLAGILLLYLGIFGLVMFTIPRLLFLNQHAFKFTVWPCAILTAFALTSLDAKWFRRALVAVALPSLLFCFAKIHDYRASAASVALGRWLAATTNPKEIVFSNLTDLKPPVEPWDGECFANAKAVADRFVASGVSTEAALIQAARPFKGRLTDAAFLHECSQPMDAALAANIVSGAQTVLVTNLPVPPEGLMIYKTARASLFSLLGKRAPQNMRTGPQDTPRTNVFSLELYHLSPAMVQTMNRQSAP